MFTNKKKLIASFAVLAAVAVVVPVTRAIAASQAASVPAPDPKYVAAGESEALRLLLLMDTDKNGKISKAEYMAFMEAEFNRLDINKDGELDVKELEQSHFQAVHHGGGHR